MRNFARYVTWPAGAFASERAPWSVCIVGSGHFDESLEKTFLGRTEQGRAFEVLRAVNPEQLPACQIAYIDMDSTSRRRAALAALRKLPVLTVGSSADFLSEGGIVRLLATERIEMSINLDQARAVALSISTKMLEVAQEVLENGVLRRLR